MFGDIVQRRRSVAADDFYDLGKAIFVYNTTMTSLQNLSITLFAVFNFLVFIFSLYQCKYKNNNLGITYPLLPLGIFVWADGVIFGLFWLGAAIVSLALNDWVLFLLIFSVFWLVRSVGETIYYFNQQFSEVKRMPGKSLPGYKIFNDEYTIWFIYQITCQVITVVSVITTVYLFNLWL